MIPSKLTEIITTLVEKERGRILATLVTKLNDLQLAEDALQDALVKAVETWQQTGIPKNPVAWLLKVAGRKMLDHVRRNTNFQSKHDAISATTLTQEDDDPMSPFFYHDDNDIPDERLRLIFTCCHPALAVEARIPLTLQLLGGLTTTEIAKAFLTPKTTMAQRLVRAKRKIKHANIPYEIPKKNQLEDRLQGVLKVLYLIFNEGYAATSGMSALRNSLIDEAMRLTRILIRLIPTEAEPLGLLSLMMHHDARSPARVDESGIVLLESQNRNLWKRGQIEEAEAILEKALTLFSPGPYQIQAAISSLHNASPNHDATDWKQIYLLYDRLHTIQPSPIVRLNAAVALSYAGGVEAALEYLEPLQNVTEMKSYLPYYATFADIFRRDKNAAVALEHYKVALSLAENELEKQFFSTQIVAMESD